MVGNAITELPSDMGELTLLRSLRCDVETFTSPPPEVFAQGIDVVIEYLARMEMARTTNDLALSDMGLQSLPSAVLEMESLQRLNLDGNNLRSLPPTFTRLQYLKEISLQGNPIVALPPEIGTIPALTELQYDRTVLRNPPAEILDRGLEVIVQFLKRLYDAR